MLVFVSALCIVSATCLTGPIKSLETFGAWPGAFVDYTYGVNVNKCTPWNVFVKCSRFLYMISLQSLLVQLSCTRCCIFSLPSEEQLLLIPMSLAKRYCSTLSTYCTSPSYPPYFPKHPFVDWNSAGSCQWSPSLSDWYCVNCCHSTIYLFIYIYIFIYLFYAMLKYVLLISNQDFHFHFDTKKCSEIWTEIGFQKGDARNAF